MKYVKILGLAAVAAMALMAFAGAGTASASTLCQTTVDSCPAAWDYPTGTAISASLTSASATLEVSGLTEDTCTTSAVAGTTSNTGSSSETVEGAIGTLTFTNCTNTTKVLAKGNLEVHADGGHGAGILTGKGNRVTVVAFGFISCVANTGTGTNLGTIDEPANATSDAVVTVNATIPLEGAGCPANAQWTATYTVTSPTPLYVSTS
jgi:hypothetical protein